MNRLKSSLPSFSSTSKSDPPPRPTSDPLSPSQLDLISSRKSLLTSLVSTFTSYYKTLSKERNDPRTEGGIGVPSLSGLRGGTNSSSGDGGGKQLPTKWVGQAFVEAADSVELNDGRYSSALSIVGQLHLSLGDLSTTLHDGLREGYLERIEERFEEIKGLEKLLKDAEKKRSTLEGFMGKMEKSKKSREDVEHELDQLEWAYSDACETIQSKFETIEGTVEDDIEALRNLIECQFRFATNYVDILQRARSQFPSSSSSSGPQHRTTTGTSNSPLSFTPTASTSPARSRSSTLQQPQPIPASTRMNRSFSDSSTHSTGGGFGSGLLSSLGPGRSRRSTVSSTTQAQAQEKGSNEGEKESKKENRSRSGSVLERFALTNGGKKKNVESGTSEQEGGAEEEGSKSEQQRSRSNSAASNPSSRWIPSPPSLPTMPSFKKLSISSTPKYGTLKDRDQKGFARNGLDREADEEEEEVERDPYGEDLIDPSSYSSTLEFTPRRTRTLPPPLNRTQTAPPLSTPSTFSLSHDRNPLPRTYSSISTSTSTAESTVSPVGRTYRAKWTFSTSSTDELSFEKGDLIRVEKRVDENWWIGRTMGGNMEEKGMFPSAYVVLHDEEEETRFGGGGRDFDRDSMRSSTSTRRSTSTTDDDEEEEEEEEDRRLNSTEKPFAGQNYSPMKNRPSPPIPMPRQSSSTGGVRKQPPPPPPTRGASSVGKNTRREEEEEEGSPFD
ncbi:BAR and SH3 domain-containing protein [Sporobolomyces salmoneus]|uniref:BAR and SH3 domain-containing protein n=1 Tax=Sporobolomyces salmoneus TaxID=183962 RepID=UPI00317C4851